MPTRARPDRSPPPADPGPIPVTKVPARRRRAGFAAAALVTLTLSLGCSNAPLLCDSPEGTRVACTTAGEESSIGALFGVISGFFTTETDH